MLRESKPRSRLVVTLPVEWHRRYDGFDLQIVSNGEVWAEVRQDGSWTVYDERDMRSNLHGQAATLALARRAVEKALGVRRVKA